MKGKMPGKSPGLEHLMPPITVIPEAAIFMTFFK
jgi:hypothetical protein